MIIGCIIFALLFSAICAVYCLTMFAESYVDGKANVDMFMLGLFNFLTSVFVTVILASVL